MLEKCLIASLSSITFAAISLYRIKAPHQPEASSPPRYVTKSPLNFSLLNYISQISLTSGYKSNFYRAYIIVSILSPLVCWKQITHTKSRDAISRGVSLPPPPHGHPLPVTPQCQSSSQDKDICCHHPQHPPKVIAIKNPSSSSYRGNPHSLSWDV